MGLEAIWDVNCNGQEKASPLMSCSCQINALASCLKQKNAWDLKLDEISNKSF